MTGEGPEVRPRPLAEAGTVAGDVVRGEERALALFPEGAKGPVDGNRGRASRVPASAFGLTDAASRDELERILGGEGFFVTTGQQPVLFLGPLYVLYKALTAVSLATELRERLEVPVMALFWVGSDDHDWEEVGASRLLDTENRLRTVRLEAPPGREGRAVGPSELPEAVEDLLDDVDEILPDTEFSDTHLRLLRDRYRPGHALGAAFGRSLAGLLEERPLAWLDSAHPEVREASAPLLLRLLEERDEVAEARAAGHQRVERTGYAPQLHLMEDGLPLFVDRPGGRRRVRVAETGDGTEVRLGGDGERLAPAELAAELEERPERFSPNVASRPVLESWLLPAGAAVLGPGEVGYWAELGDLFGWAGVRMPRLVPRLSAVVVEEKVGKVLRKLDAGPEAFEDGGEELVRRVTERGRPAEVEAALEAARRSVVEAFGEVEEAVEERLPGIRSAVGAARHEALQALSGLEGAVDDRVREQQEVVVAQIRKAAVHLFPGGRPQERVLSPLYYLVRYGGAFLRRVEGAARDRPEGGRLT